MIDINRLNDNAAERILTTIARVRPANRPIEPDGLRDELARTFSVARSDTSVSAGDLARQALIILAEDSATQVAIQSIAGENETAVRHTFDGGGTIALGIAAYYALSTALDIQRDKAGK